MHPVESLSDEPISRLGSLPLFSISATHTVMDALRSMQAQRRGCVVVCEGKIPVGVITERDILRRIGTSLPLDVPVSQVISGEVWSVRVTDSLETALRAMNRHQCRHLIVVNETGEAVGILSVRRIVRALVEHFPSSVYNLPPVSNQVQTDREGA
jgi:CBS domain-containing protein